MKGSQGGTLLQRPGTAPKRPASPAAALQSGSAKNGLGPNDFSLGVLAGSSGFSGGIKGSKFQIKKKNFLGSGSHKPSSAPGKSRLRSSSPSSALQNQDKKLG